MNLQQAVPFFGVTDILVSVDYYMKGLGFEMPLHWINKGRLCWCNLRRDGVDLMLQEFFKGDDHHPPNTPAGEKGLGMSVCIICKDALALYHEFTAKGIPVEEPFVGNGMWVIGLKDPDGYKLFFESPTDVPEETKYSEWLNA